MSPRLLREAGVFYFGARRIIKSPVEKLSEIQRIERLRDLAVPQTAIRELARVSAKGHEFPIYSVEIGSADRNLPVLGLFGGVHGLERVGAQSVLSYLESLFEQLKWDEHLRESFSRVRIVSIPMLNPGGTYLGTRSNPRGVDLMRNAPVEAPQDPALLIGGHRLTKLLPYYRGEVGQPMEIEAQTLVDYVKKEVFQAAAAIMVDVHSGFGIQDRLWYPFARSTEPFPQMNQVGAVKELLDRTHPNHIYLIEPQSLSYTTHGDLWDYIFDEWSQLGRSDSQVFLPWTLEMGSWLWVRKNPLQLFSAFGRFNPIKIHRYRRIMRRHLPLFDFFLRAVKNHKSWKV